MARMIVLLLVTQFAIVFAQESKPQWQRLLQGDDATKAAELQKTVDEHVADARWAEAVKSAEELQRLRESKQGKDHWEASNAQQQAGILEKVSKASAELQKRYGESLSLNQQIQELVAQQQYAEAIRLQQQVLEVMRELFGEQHSQTANSLSNLGYFHHLQGKYAEAERLYRQALTIRENLLGERHLDTAVSFNNLAQLQREIGKLPAAEEFQRKALLALYEIVGEMHPNTAGSIVNLALIQKSQGKFHQAEQGYRRALALQIRLLGEQHPSVAQTYNNLASVQFSQGKIAEAEIGFRRALAIQLSVREFDANTALFYNNLAKIEEEQGDLDEAERFYRKALDIFLRLVSERHPNTALAYNNLASMQLSQGKLDEAEANYRKALEIRLQVQKEQHPDTAISYANLANVALQQRRWPEAEQGFRKALEIRQRLFGEQHPDIAYSYNQLGALQEKQKKYTEAESLFRKSLAVFESTLGESHPDTVRSLVNLAKCRANLGEDAKALEAIQQATARFEIARRRIADSGLKRASYTSERSPLPFAAALLARAGKYEEAWNRYEQSIGQGTSEDWIARRSLPDAARDRQNELQTQLDRLQAQLQRASLIRQPTESQVKQNEQLSAQILKLQNEQQKLRNELEQQYGVLERVVLDIPALQHALSADAAYIGWLDQESQHWAVLLKKRGEPIWIRLPGTGPDGVWTEEDDRLAPRLRDRLANRTDGWQPLARRLQAQRLTPLAEHLKGVRQLIALPSEQLAGIPLEALAEDTTISYAISASLFASQQQLRPTSVGLVALGDPNFTSPTQPALPLPPGGLLVTTVLPGSTGATSGLLARDVLLRCDETELKQTEDLSTAIARANKVANLRVWRMTAEGTGSRELTVEVPVGKLGVILARDPAPKALLAMRQSQQLLTVRDAKPWQPLPGSRYEVSAISKLFTNSKATLLLGSDANETRLAQLAQDGTLSKARFLHFATHGEAKSDKPLSSRIILSRDKLSEDQRGELVAEQVLLSWNLKSELVTLSACQTGLGKYESGEGYVGFAQALLLTGTRSVCLSLWNVNDVSTALLMEKFYDNLLTKKMGKAAALADAKKWLRTLPRDEALKRLEIIGAGVERGPGAKELPRIKLPDAPKDQPPYAHPYYWAPFILVGERD